MFGFFYSLFNASAKYVSDVKNNSYDMKQAKEAKKDGIGYYYDHKGIKRDPKTHDVFRYRVLPNGDDVRVDKRGNIIQNISEERRAEKVFQASMQGKVMTAESVPGYTQFKRNIHGHRYRDLKTKHLLVERIVDTDRMLNDKVCKKVKLFLDLETERFIRPSDNTLNDNKYNKDNMPPEYYFTDEEFEEIVKKENIALEERKRTVKDRCKEMEDSKIFMNTREPAFFNMYIKY